MKKNNHDSFDSWRFYLVLVVVALVILAVVARVAYLTVVDRSFLTEQGNARALRVISTPAYRGMMVDRNGTPLAVSTPVDTVWVNPQEFSPSAKELAQIAQILSLPLPELQAHLTKNKTKQFLYVKRGVPPEVSANLMTLELPGLYFEHTYRRYYPDAESVSQVLGITNVDNQGQSGLELSYNNVMAGVPSKTLVEQDRYGHTIARLKQVQQERPGETLTLSIDERVQYVAYEALKDAMKENVAQSGSAIVVDVTTGEILAMTNFPSFNPNNRPKDSDGRYRNRAVTDVLEPGSVMKTFAAVNALEHHYTPDSVVNTHPGWMRIGKYIVRDEEHDHGTLTLTGVLQKSSNVGITKITLTLPPDSLYHTLHQLGFGQATGIHFPGEQDGVLVNRKRWPEITLATLSWGYGMSTTPLQVARGYAALANHGVLLPMTFLKQDKPVHGEQVVDAQVAQTTLAMLETVLAKDGTGYLARVPGYRVAGKTGTARIAIRGGYSKHDHVASFIGIAPASHPRLVVLVVITRPKGKQYYASYVAAPAFQKIMSAALRYLNVPPDDVSHENDVMAAHWKAPI